MYHVRLFNNVVNSVVPHHGDQTHTAAAARVVVPAAAAEASSLVVRSWTVYTLSLIHI